MKDLTFWKHIIMKMKERIDVDTLIYGDAFVEIEYEGTLLKSIKFDGTMMSDKIKQFKK